MKRRILALLLPLALLLCAGARAAAEPGALLARQRVYEGQFADVSADAWYAGAVAAGYEYGLFSGREGGFAPDAEITLAELLTLSARIHAVWASETIPAAAPGEAWYLPYAAYLSDRGLLSVPLADCDAPATRAQLAAVFAHSLPEGCFGDLNAALLEDARAAGFVADVGPDTPYREDILWLYRQGLLAGMDERGSFLPDASTTRAETAALVTRLVDPSLRITLGWSVPRPWSAAGATLPGLVEAPDAVSNAPDYEDEAALDALVRKMLAAGEHTISLQYDHALSRSDASALANRFTSCVKTYCEQMYNFVLCQTYRDGSATLTFCATACLPEAAEKETAEQREARMAAAGAQLERYRAETMAKAIEVHDMLWETGQLGADMSQLEIARVYFAWLCDNCAYDDAGASDDYSVSHIAYSALVDGRAVCDGYTGAYNLLLKLEGIDCRALHNRAHIWTVATLDGTEYHIDPTWGDQTGRVNMSYFCMTPEESMDVHPW